jgi:hypothetical protein
MANRPVARLDFTIETRAAMVARVDWTTDIPQAWIKDGLWTLIIRSYIGDETADYLSDAVNDHVRIDRLLVLFQQIPNNPVQQIPHDLEHVPTSLLHTRSCLHAITASWIQTFPNMNDTLWWEVAPTCFTGRVKAKVKTCSDGSHVIDPDGTVIEGLLGPWVVKNKGYGSTLVGETVVKFNVQLLVSHSDLIEFEPPLSSGNLLLGGGGPLTG